MLFENTFRFSVYRCFALSLALISFAAIQLVFAVCKNGRLASVDWQKLRMEPQKRCNQWNAPWNIGFCWWWLFFYIYFILHPNSAEPWQSTVYMHCICVTSCCWFANAGHWVVVVVFFLFLGNCIKPITNTIFVLNNINVLFCVVAHSKNKKRSVYFVSTQPAADAASQHHVSVLWMRNSNFLLIEWKIRSLIFVDGIEFAGRNVSFQHTHTHRGTIRMRMLLRLRRKSKKKKQNTNLMLMDWYLIPFEWMFLLCGLMIAFSFALFVAIGNFCYLNAGLSKLYSDRSRAFVQRRHCPNLRNKFCHVHPMRQNAR